MSILTTYPNLANSANSSRLFQRIPSVFPLGLCSTSVGQVDSLCMLCSLYAGEFRFKLFESAGPISLIRRTVLSIPPRAPVLALGRIQ